MNYDLADEQALIAAVRAGEQAAWEYITRKYYAPILNFIYNMVRDHESAKELIQDVFVNFWVKRDHLYIKASLKAYLYKAARNTALNFVKRKKFEANYQADLAKKLVIHQNETEDTLHFNELEKALYDAIANLPEKGREIFKLSRFEGMTYKEISETMDIPIRTVHYQIGLSLKALREKLKGIANPNLM